MAITKHNFKSGEVILASDFNQLENDIDNSLKNYLPLSGGIMVAPITMSNNIIALKRDTDTTSLQINGADSYQNGAYAIFYGKNNSNTDYQGAFQLSARKDSAYSLLGRSDGTLKWSGKEVERVNSSGDNYIRYESGLQICWGIVTDISAQANTLVNKDITFPQPFKDVNFKLSTNIFSQSTSYEDMPKIQIGMGNRATTGIKAYIWCGALTSGRSPAIDYVAIGLWK